MGASVVGSLGIVSLGAGGGALPAFTTGQTVSINTTFSPYTVPAGVINVRNAAGPNGALTINLPSFKFGTCVDGQLFVFNNFDTGQSTIIIQTPSGAPGDNIEGGTQHYISEYAAFCVLKARVDALGNTNWTFFSQNTRDTSAFPQSLALAANLTNSPFGSIVIPGGVKALRSAFFVVNSNLTGGQVAVTIAGDIAAPHTFTISTTSTRATGQLLSPGTANWLTVPALAPSSTPSGSLITATVTTNGTFAGPTAGQLFLETY